MTLPFDAAAAAAGAAGFAAAMAGLDVGGASPDPCRAITASRASFTSVAV